MQNINENLENHIEKTTINKSLLQSPVGLLALFIFAHFGHHVLLALPIPLLPMVRNEFALGYTQAGLLISAFSLSYGISQIPAGWLADRLGPRILITIGISGVAMTGFLIGLSHSYFMMIVFMVLMGVTGGGYHPATPPVISNSFEEKHQGRALGFHMIGGTASMFLTPLIAAVIATAWGWRGSFIGLAVPTILFGIIFYVILGRKAEIEKKSRSDVLGYKEESFSPGHFRRLVAFIFLSTSTWAVMLSVIAFIPLFIVDTFGVREETAAASLAIIYFAGFWACPLGGYLSDRLGSVPVLLVVCYACGPLIYLLNILPFGLGFSVLLFILGMSILMRAPLSESYIISHAPERHRSTVLGIYFFSGLEGGGVLTPLMGLIIDKLGFYLSFTIAGVTVVALTLACSFYLWGHHE